MSQELLQQTRVELASSRATRSGPDWRLSLWQIVLSSDEAVFGGWENVSKKYDVAYQTDEGLHDNRPQSMLVYAPSRTVAVYAKAEFCDATGDAAVTGIPGLGVKGRGPHWQA